MTDFDAARKNMVDCQLRTNAVTDKVVLAAMGEVPREAFLPTAQQGVAYVDEDVELGDGRYLMEPLVLARLLQTAAIAPDDAALLVGCGSGYAAAVVARIASSVVALECETDRVAAAGARLSELGYDNVAVVEGNLEEGYRDQAPYAAIIFSGAVSEVPSKITEQLDEGGRLVCVVDAECEGLGQVVLVTRNGGTNSQRICFDASTPLLPGFARAQGFVF